MPRQRVWFIPVFLNETGIPSHPISDHESLKDIQAIELFKEWDIGISKIVQAIKLYELPPVVSLPDFTVFRDIDKPWCPEMVALPGGQFLMGCSENEKPMLNVSPNGQPQHRVTIEYRFAIGCYPVTFEEFAHFCDAMKQMIKEGYGSWGRKRRPVLNVTWRKAVGYCVWLSRATNKKYRLPSEAEWEYSCRAGTATRYSFGDRISKINANYHTFFDFGFNTTVDVGSYPANPWGLYDMHGNVDEWVEDVWHKNYLGAPNDGSAWTDGEGEDSPLPRVFRGGNCCDPDVRLVSSCRIGNKALPNDCVSVRGFRVARTL